MNFNPLDGVIDVDRFSRSIPHLDRSFKELMFHYFPFVWLKIHLFRFPPFC